MNSERVVNFQEGKDRKAEEVGASSSSIASLEDFLRTVLFPKIQ